MKLFVNKLGKGNPIIILHGFLGTSDNWYSIGKSLSEKFLVYLVDQRNHGRSPRSPDISYDLMAKDLKEFIDEYKLENPIIMGHSMGGKVAMQYSRLYKDQFDKLIIVDIAPKYYPPHHQTILSGLLSINVKTLKSRSEADKQLSKYINNYSIRQFLLKNLDRTDEGFQWKANIPVLNEKINNVGVSTYEPNVSSRSVYFLKGENSDYIVNEDRKDIKSMYHQAKIITIKNSSHWVHADQPNSFLGVINEILRQE